jgi:cytochrome c-type biogenesis protein CcmH
MTSLATCPSLDIPSIKDQLSQLKDLHDAGTLTTAVYDEARAKLERRILDWALRDLPQELNQEKIPTLTISNNIEGGESATASSRPSKGVIVALSSAIFLAVLAIAGYLWLGRGASTEAPSAAGGSVMSQPSAEATIPSKPPHTNNLDEISVMTDKLATRLKSKPDDAQGWAMLARSYGVLGNHPEALKAYEKALVLLPKDPVLLADYAEALALANKAGAPGGASITSSMTTKLGVANTSGKTLSGMVTLAPDLAKNVKPDDTLFVVARPQEGSRMPLAMLQKKVKDLPLQFTLDDSMGMSPAVKLSTAGKVVVSARITKSGSPMPEKGDLSGQSVPVSVGVNNLAIEINGVIKP